MLRHLQAEEAELRQELVSGNLDVSQAWWTDNGVYRERAEARLEELGPILALVREWCGQEDLARWLRSAGHHLKTALMLKELGPTDEDR